MIYDIYDIYIIPLPSPNFVRGQKVQNFASIFDHANFE